jgi:S-adenosylmethionine decarboxylase
MHFKNQDFLLKNNKIDQIFFNALRSADLTILDIFHHNYNPYGYSAVAILKTSHATIHSWPEHGYISIDIFICDEFSKGLETIKILKDKFQPMKSEFFYMERGIDSRMEYKPIE